MKLNKFLKHFNSLLSHFLSTILINNNFDKKMNTKILIDPR